MPSWRGLDIGRHSEARPCYLATAKRGLSSRNFPSKFPLEARLDERPLGPLAVNPEINELPILG